MFEQAGLPADWQPTSWQEWLDAARTIKEKQPDVTPIQLNAGTAMGEATTMQGYYMALLGAGSHIYDFATNKWIVSSQAILDTLNLYKTIYIDEGLGDPRCQLTQDGRNQSFEDFAQGQDRHAGRGRLLVALDRSPRKRRLCRWRTATKSLASPNSRP